MIIILFSNNSNMGPLRLDWRKYIGRLIDKYSLVKGPSNMSSHYRRYLQYSRCVALFDAISTPFSRVGAKTVSCTGLSFPSAIDQ